MLSQKNNAITSTAVSTGLSTLAILIFAVFNIGMQISTPVFFPRVFGEFNLHHSLSMIFYVTYTVFITLTVPVALNTLLGKNNLQSLGIRKPENLVMTTFYTIIALLILVPIMVNFTRRPEFLHYYNSGRLTIWHILFVNVVMMPIFYFCEEFFYRGFLFLSLWRKVKWHSFWITDIIFTLAHLYKPGLEILLCIPASIIFNFLTLKSKSILPAFLVHGVLGIILYVNVALIANQ